MAWDEIQDAKSPHRFMMFKISSELHNVFCTLVTPTGTYPRSTPKFKGNIRVVNTQQCVSYIPNALDDNVVDGQLRSWEW